VSAFQYPAWVIPADADVCAATGARHGHQDARPAQKGSDLCIACHRRFPKLLLDLSSYPAVLTDAITARRGTRYDNPRVQSSPADTAPTYNGLADVARTDLADWAGYLVRTIRSEGPHRDMLRQNMLPGESLLAMSRWHAGWLSHYPGLGPSWLADADRLLRQCGGALDAHAPRFRRVIIREGVCMQEVEDTDLGPIICGAPLVGLIPPGGGKRPAEIVCTADPTHQRIPIEDWILHH
jgi:hypothetical protein